MADDNKVFAELTRFWEGSGMKSDVSTIINFGYKWLGDKKAKCLNSWDYKGSWNKSGDRYQNCDKKLCKDIYKIMSEADVIVGHYSSKFDLKFIQGRLMANGLPSLPTSLIHVDTCMLARRNMNFKSNRLDNLAVQLGTERKMDHGLGWRLWVYVRKGIKKYMRIMTKYCAQDVDALEKVFLKLRPFAKNIPHANKGGRSCPVCGSSKVHRHGWRATKAGKYRRYKCENCGSYSRGKNREHKANELRGI